MNFTPELLAAAVVAVVFLLGLLALLFRRKKTRTVGRRTSREPANLRFTCAGCSLQFTHSRRTLSAWAKGTRQFYCNACHTKSSGARAAQQMPRRGPPLPGEARQAQARSAASAMRTEPAPGGKRGGIGCLSVIALLIVVPISIGIAVSLYA